MFELSRVTADPPLLSKVPRFLPMCFSGEKVGKRRFLGFLINFRRGILTAGNWTPLDLFLFPLILFLCRSHARRIRRKWIHNLRRPGRVTHAN